MAMLAGPRRKQKVINLRAKNNAWSNDSTKFGQRMLEKMGWSEGKGLGAKENGIVDHVVARYKNDDRGLGFEDRNDQWTKHEDDFNSLLANLSNGDTNDEQLHSGVSLEVKSKKSKARVHYHKFTRGKDLTRYSEKDLANIFGKKTLKEKQKPQAEVENESPPTEQVFTEKGSMEDYFKSKLAAVKAKSNINIPDETSYDDDNMEYAFQGFAGSNNKEAEEESHQGFGFTSFSLANTDDNLAEDNSPEQSDGMVEIKKKSKKKKKQKLQDEISQENIVEDDKSENTVPNCDVDDDQVKTKKSKKKKRKEAEELDKVDSKDTVVEEPVQEDYVPKKKKKRKNKAADE
ncbi:unnamed protein product [Chrysodeixis includens]|uniref:G-patch domain-containing protein n=1 Tax=Chrysodeixis includens TaxID=689277 RepID=A0A9N8Q2M9_CHRIL|nr:unnamed protein product [Chrysodeixis includens]